MSAEPQCVAELCSAGEFLLPANVRSVRRCPARSDYVELCFETDEGRWTWCCPEVAEGCEAGIAGDALAITPGPYGARVRHFENGRLGAVLPSCDALVWIVGGSPTYVARALVKRGQ